MEYMFYMGSQEILLIIPVLLNVAFITLMERKVLGYSQNRKGPNKVFLFGVFQPFADAVKLFTKEVIFPSKGNFLMFYLSPLVLISLMSLFWLIIPLKEKSFMWLFNLIFFLAILSLNIYPLFMSGWSSNSKYGMIGAIRGISQAISYEISLALILMSLCSFCSSVELEILSYFNEFLGSFCFMFPLFLLWLVSCVAETNRTPFDFSEGESELVSGFNIEYGGFLFAILFMSEYGMILIFSALTSNIFLIYSLSNLMGVIMMVILAFFWVWLRATYPRFRYDKLMNLGWKILLPVSLILVGYNFCILFVV